MVSHVYVYFPEMYLSWYWTADRGQEVHAIILRDVMAAILLGLSLAYVLLVSFSLPAHIS